MVRTERDLLREQLSHFKRQLFAARSEAAATNQKDLFFNEAEVEGKEAQPAGEELDGDDKVEVPAHKRAKRGRKPLDPALPREVIRHELPDHERACPHDGATLTEISVEASEQLDVIPQQVRVIRHERVKYACPCCDGGLRLAAKPPQMIPNVRADLAQTTAARGAAACVAVRIHRSIGGVEAVHMVLARHVLGQLPVECCAVGGLWLGRRLGCRLFIQWCAFDQRDLRVIELLARASELGSTRAQQLKRELVDHQLEEHHLGVPLLEGAQQRFDGEWRG